MKRYLITVGILLLIAMLASSALAGADRFTDGKSWGPVHTQININLKLDRSTYKVGENARIKLRANQDCYFVLYSINSLGNASIVCPSYYSPNNRLYANRDYYLRDVNGNFIEQKGPVGRETLQVIATKKPINMAVLSPYLQNTSTVVVVTNPSQFVTMVTREIKDRVKQWGPASTPRVKPTGVYGFTSAQYNVVSANATMFTNTQPAPSQISIRLQTNKVYYKIGEQAIITLVADQDCYFILYSIDSRGQAVVVAPSNYCKSHFLKKNQVLIIKDNSGNLVEQKGPPGVEHLQVIASKKPINVVQFQNCVQTTSTVYNVTNPTMFVTMVTREMQKRITEDNKHWGSKPRPTGSGVYGVDTVKYTVVQ